MQNSQAIYEQSTPTFVYMATGHEILPFRNEHGVPNFSNTHLAQIFRRMAMEETVSKVFFDGSINNTSDFIKFCHNPDNEVFILKSWGRDAGFFWLNRFRHKSFFITYCFFKNFWGRQAQEISDAALDFLFSRTDDYGEHQTDVLLGLTPADNRLALKFMLKNNMTIFGRVPDFIYDHQEGKSIDGIISYLQREKSTMSSLTGLFFFQ